MCRNLILVTSVAVAVAFSLFTGTYGQEETLCRGQPLNMTDKQKAIISDCLTENKIKSIWKIPVERLTCFGVCILKKKDLLTKEGRLDHDKIFSYIEMVMKPDEVKKPLKDGTEKCIKDHGQNVVVEDDPTCSKFMEVGQCVHDIFLDNCIQD